MTLGRQPKVTLPNGATVRQQPRLPGLQSGCVVRTLQPQTPARYCIRQQLLPHPPES